MPSADEGRRHCDLLVRNAHILTMNDARTVYPRGALAMSGRDIVAVGPERDVLATWRAGRTLDAGGGVVHPGLVEAHYHMTLHLTRGTLSDAPHVVDPAGGGDGQIGLYSQWFNALDDDEEYANALLAAVEMARNGVTCFMEPGTVFSTDAVAAAVDAVGIRGSLADPFLWDHPEGLSMAREIDRAPATTEHCLDLLGNELRRNADPDARVRGHVAIYGTGTMTDELAVAAKQCADEAGVVLTLHQNFEPPDAAFDDERYRRPGVEYLAELGVLGRHTSLAHMNILRDGEIEALRAAGAGIVWHPGNYLFYGISASVPCRVPELVERGVRVALMTDVAKVWAIGEMGWVGYLTARMGEDFLSSEQILEMQTRGGAESVGLADRIGSLEPGKRADVVIRGLDVPEAYPGTDPVRETVLVSRSKSVDTVIVDGEIIVRGGRLTRMDEHVAYDLARTSARRLAERLDLPRPGSWPEES
jgi:5-methylthioadenosine/S-adenosylhomocysteine deaminase